MSMLRSVARLCRLGKLSANRLGPLVLLALGAASILVDLLAYLKPFPLAEWWQHALLDYAWLTGYELSGEVRFVGAFLLLLGLFQLALGLARARPDAAPLALILSVQLGLGLSLVGMYPVAAIDLYDYLLYGRLGLFWQANPLAHPPSQFPAEPMLGYSYWPNEPSVYGPLWQDVSLWVTALVDGRLPDGLYAFKLLAVLAALATTIVVWLTVRSWRPALAPAAALFYGWNPLQQFETAGNGHNDAVMVLFLALSLLLLLRGPRLLALPALTLGLLVKITLAPLVPLVALAPLLLASPWRVRLRDTIGGVALSVALAIALYAPYWEGRASLPFLDRGNWFTASPPTLLRELLRRSYPFEEAGRLAAMLCAALFALLAAVVLAKLIIEVHGQPPANAYDAVLRAGYGIFFAYLVVACLWWQPWYLLVLLAVAALIGDRALDDRANLFALGGFLSYPVFKYIWAVHQPDWQLDYPRIMAMSVVVIFTLPLAHLAVDLAARAWRLLTLRAVGATHASPVAHR